MVFIFVFYFELEKKCCKLLISKLILLFRYHTTCYRSFTRRELTTPSTSFQPSYDTVFERFAKEVVIPRIVENGEVLTMARLRSIYKQYAEETNDICPPEWFRSTHLKKKLRERFPELTFSFPSGQRNKSQNVFFSKSTSLQFSLTSDVQ